MEGVTTSQSGKQWWTRLWIKLAYTLPEIIEHSGTIHSHIDDSRHFGGREAEAKVPSVHVLVVTGVDTVFQ